MSYVPIVKTYGEHMLSKIISKIIPKNPNHNLDSEINELYSLEVNDADAYFSINEKHGKKFISMYSSKGNPSGHVVYPMLQGEDEFDRILRNQAIGLIEKMLKGYLCIYDLKKACKMLKVEKTDEGADLLRSLDMVSGIEFKEMTTELQIEVKRKITLLLNGGSLTQMDQFGSGADGEQENSPAPDCPSDESSMICEPDPISQSTIAHTQNIEERIEEVLGMNEKATEVAPVDLNAQGAGAMQEQKIPEHEDEFNKLPLSVRGRLIPNYRTCNSCKEVLVLNTNNFYRKSKNRYGFDTICSSCIRIATKKRKEAAQGT